MQIDLLYFDDCPSWKAARKNLEAALLAEGLEPDIRLVRVETNQEASDQKFLGSPSFQVNGVDLWTEQRQDYNLSCRLYATPHGIDGAPSVEMLREKLRSMRI